MKGPVADGFFMLCVEVNQEKAVSPLMGPSGSPRLQEAVGHVGG